MDKINFSEEEISNIIKLHNEGYLNREIALKYEVSISTISRLLQKTNLPSRHPLLTQQRKDSVCRLYLDGKSKNEISKILNMSFVTIKNILIENNIDSRTMSEEKMKYTLDVTYFDNIDSHEKAYWLGLLYADGCVYNNSIQLSLQEQDKHILDSFLFCLKTNRPLRFLNYNSKNSNHKNQYCISIVNKHMSESLIKHGVLQNKSLVLEFPYDLDEQFYSSFILGYMDGDGNISKKEGRCNFVSTEKFCNYIKNYLKNTLDINSSVMYCHNKTDRSTRVLQIAGNKQVKKFLDWIYKNSKYHLFRKYNLYVEKYCS